MKQEDKQGVVLFDSPEAARPVTMEGWISRNGHFFHGVPAERLARYDGCTHYRCKTCGEQYRKTGYCQGCAARRSEEQWRKMPSELWDEKGFLWVVNSEAGCFDDLSEVIEYCVDYEMGDPRDLRLELCRPVFARTVDARACYLDMPEGMDIPDKILDAFTVLNQSLSDYNEPLWWEPKGVKAIIPDELWVDAGLEPRDEGGDDD